VIAAHGGFDVVGIVERRRSGRPGPEGIEIIGADEDLAVLSERYTNFAVTIGQVGRSGRRKELFEYLAQLGVRLPTIVSPLARVAASAQLGAGTVVMHDAMVNAGARIGDNCIVNTCALVEHDTVIGDHCHVAPGAIINGQCSIGSNVFVGSGAIICHQLQIADGAIIGAGCVAVETIEEAGTYVGSPARRVVAGG
jgi:sugar O-acyltransferase (sialic acid O-acetyltransferase NeuD family)